MPENEQQLSSTPQEHVPAAKQTLWEQKSRKLDGIRDGLGKGIDGGIKETVVGLNVLGINTNQSCEGHLDWGTGAPWIDLQAPDVEELSEQMYAAYDAYDAAQIPQEKTGEVSSEEEEQLGKRANELRREVKRRNLQEAAKAMGLLAEFYAKRDVPYDRRLILKISTAGYSRIASQGADFQETAPVEIKQQKLTEYQEEMRGFTTFLKEKYFSY